MTMAFCTLSCLHNAVRIQDGSIIIIDVKEWLGRGYIDRIDESVPERAREKDCFFFYHCLSF